MIDVQNEKNRISEMAIRGALSKRVNSALDVDTIISNIKTVRDILIKNKESKISKTAPMMDDIPFEIPLGWKWVALGDLCVLLSRGKSPKYSEKKKYPVFAQKCNQPNGLALEKALFLDEDTLDKWPLFFRLQDADVVINSTGTGTVGRVGYYSSQALESQYDFMVPDSHVTVVRVGENVISKYIYYALRTNTIQSIMEKTYKGSTNQKEFYIDSVYSIPVPLPTFEEQQQIVSILDNAYVQLDIIDALQKQYESDRENLKGKIIDAGIRGKLTEQLSKDGNVDDLYAKIQEEKTKKINSGLVKRTKQLVEITEEEKPFDIPDNWKWCRLESLFNFIDYRGVTPNKIADGVPFVTAKNVRKGYIDYSIKEYISEDDYQNRQSRGVSHKGDLLLTTEAPMGYAAIADLDKFSAGQRLITLQQYTDENLIDNKYYMYCISSRFFQKQLDEKCSGTTVKGIKADRLKSFLVPLPPADEQRRMVTIIESILNQLDT